VAPATPVSDGRRPVYTFTDDPACRRDGYVSVERSPLAIMDFETAAQGLDPYGGGRELAVMT